MADLKLIALDPEDLAVVSSHLQDAVVKVADLAYLPRQKRFAAIFNRFDWATALENGGRVGKRPKFHRRRAALRFERVLAARITGIDLEAKDQVLALLALQFEPRTPPGGILTLVFAGNAAIRLEVECIECELRDLGAAWRAKGKPEHGDEGSAKS